MLNEVRLGRCNPEVVTILRSTRNNKVTSDLLSSHYFTSSHHITHIIVFISRVLILVTRAFFTCRLIYSLPINTDADALICLYECLGRWWLTSSFFRLTKPLPLLTKPLPLLTSLFRRPPLLPFCPIACFYFFINLLSFASATSKLACA